MKIDLTKLQTEIDNGNVNVQKHPTLPLSIYKYSQQAVFTRAWNEITMICRGLVLDDSGEVVINCFPKFFNHSEADGLQGYTMRKQAGMPYTITDKMDGSLIQIARYKGQIVITSSGSFTSPQALKAAELIKGREDWIDDTHSYIFELIYPENRIVLDYGNLVSLTLLAIRHTDTGIESPLSIHIGEFDLVQTVDRFDNLDVIEYELKKVDFINKEGYIVKFDDGFRVKMKYDEYCRLHKIVSGVNEKWVWECLRDGKDPLADLTNVPDELFDFVKKAKADLQTKYAFIEKAAKAIFVTVYPLQTRKEQAAWLMKNYKHMADLVFCLLDKKDYSDKIWKRIEPEFKQGLMGMGQGPIDN